MALTNEQKKLIEQNAPGSAAGNPFAAPFAAASPGKTTGAAAKPQTQNTAPKAPAKKAPAQSTQTVNVRASMSGLTEEQRRLIEQNAPKQTQTPFAFTPTTPKQAQQPKQTQAGQQPDPSFFERLWKTLTGSGEGWAAGKVNAAGVLAEGQHGTAMSSVYNAQAEALDKQIAALEATLRDPTMTAQDIAETNDALRIALQERAKYGEAIRSGEATAGEVYKIADAIADKGQQDIERAKQGASEAGKVLVDLGANATQMGLDAASGKLTGLGSLASMGARSFGGGAQEARRDGADLQHAVNYGLASAAVEVGTEKLFDGLAGIYGKGGADDIVQGAIERLTQNEAARRALSIGAAGAGESVEELLSGLANPLLKTLYNGKSAGENYSAMEASDLLYDMLVGGLMGIVGGTVDATRGAATQEAAPFDAGARSTDAAGNLAPTETNATEAQQTGNTGINENGLAAFTPQEKVNLSSGTRNKIISSFNDALAFVRNALTNNQSVDRAYMGKVPDAVAQRVFAETGVDVQGYGVMFNGNDVRHIIKKHGDAATEAKRGQLAVTAEDIARISDIVASPDTITLSPVTDGKGRRALIFEKKIGDTLVAIEGVADGKRALETDTMRKRKSSQDTGRNAGASSNPAINAQSVPPQSSFNSDTTISQPSDVVNTAAQQPEITAPAVISSVSVDGGNGGRYNGENAERGATNGEEREADRAELHGAAGAGVRGQNVAAARDVLEGRGQDGRGDLQSAGGAYLKQSAVDAITQQGLTFVPVTETQDRAAYSALLDEARANDAKNGWAVTPKTAEELANTRIYLSDNGGVGFAVSQDGDLEAVFRNKGRKTPKRSMQSVLPQAIATGAIKGDCYGEDLVHVYEAGGAFRPVARVEFNPEYANDGWTPDKGTPYIYFLMATDTDADRVATGQGQHHLSTQEELDLLPTFDKESYDEAYAYRDMLLAQQGITPRPVTPATAAQTVTRDGVNSPGDYGSATGAAEAGFSVPHGQQVPTQNKTMTDGVVLTEKEARQFPPQPHERVTEPQSMMRAGENFYADENGNVTNLDDTVQTLLEKETWLGSDQDTAQLALAQLAREARQTGDWSRVQELAAGIERIGGTEVGRSLQARQKWINSASDIITRSMRIMESARQHAATPEVMRSISEMAFDFEEAMDAGNWTDIADIIRRTSKIRRTGSLFTNEWSNKMNSALDRTVERAQNGDAQAREFLENHAAHGLVAIAEDYTPVTFSNGLLTLRRSAMLDKISTTMRNLVSNNVFDLMDSVSNNISAALDTQLAKLTGTRSVATDRSWASEAKRKGSLDALDLALLETGLDVDATGDSGKYERGGQRTYKMRGSALARLMSTWEKHLGYRLYVTDQFQKGGIEAEIQRGLDELYNKGLITDKSLETAGATEALYRTFQDSTKLSKLSIDARRALNNLSIGGVGAGDIAIPFAQVPANLASRAMEYSPVGIANGIREMGQVFAAAKNGTLTAAQQRKAVKDLGRGLNGTAMIAAAATMALKGVLHVADVGGDEDKDKLALERQSGVNGTQINLSALERWFKGESTEWRDGDVLHSIGYLDPLNAQLTTGALIAQDLESGEDVSAYDVLKDSFEGTLQAVLDIPVMNTLKEAADAYNYSTASTIGGKVGEALEDYAAGQLTSVIPNSLKGIAQGTDEYQRDAYTADGIVGETWDAIRSAVPGLRQQLPTKQNSYGEPQENPDMLLNFINANLSPGAYNRFQRPQQEVTQELDRLNKETHDNSVYPGRKAPNSVSGGGEKYELTADEKRRFQQTAGREFLAFANAIIDGRRYDALSDEEKADAMSGAVAYASAKARQEFLDGKGKEYTISGEARSIEKAMEARRSGIDPSEYFTLKVAHDEINADKSLSSVEKATKFAVYLNDQPWLTDKKREKIKELLAYSGGFSVAANEDAMAAVDAGIDLDVWNEYHRATSAMTSDKDASGKAISGSKKAKVVAYIAAMDITAAQKDRLYLDAGYSAKDLYGQPWHR